MKFTDFKLNSKIQRALASAGYINPTEVQSRAIPLILKDHDVVVRSQTGSGKTMAYSLPLIEKIDFADTNVQVLIVCPTRELAIQVADEMQKITTSVEAIRLVTVYGGSDISRQIKALKRKPQIVVGTPGRIMDHMDRRTLKLHNLKTLVLDEADEMLNMGFKEDVETILKDTPATRQTLLFSATYPDSIRQITNNYQNKPVSIEVGKENRSLENIKQYYALVDRRNKKEAFLKLFAQMKPKNSIVFANTKKMTDDIADLLYEHGYASRALHGDLRQSQRKRVMTDIKQGKANILVASDVAARGIDINDIDFVFNYDIPHNVEYFLHRIGRTARAGKSGNAVTIITTREQLKTLRSFEEETNSVMTELTVDVAGGVSGKPRRQSRDNASNSFKSRRDSEEKRSYKDKDRDFKKPARKVSGNTGFKSERNNEFKSEKPRQEKSQHQSVKKVNIFSTFENFVDNDDEDFFGDNSDSYSYVSGRGSSSSSKGGKKPTYSSAKRQPGQSHDNRRDGGKSFERRDGGFNRDGRDNRRDGGFNRDRDNRRDGGKSFERRDGGFNRDGRDNRRDGGKSFERRDGSFNRDGRDSRRDGGRSQSRSFSSSSSYSKDKKRDNKKGDFNFGDRKSGRDFEIKNLNKSRAGYGKTNFAPKGGQRKSGRR